MIGFALEGIPNLGKSHTLKRLFDELLTNNLVDIKFYKKAKNILWSYNISDIKALKAKTIDFISVVFAR